jgi:hypothetical protein
MNKTIPYYCKVDFYLNNNEIFFDNSEIKLIQVVLALHQIFKQIYCITSKSQLIMKKITFLLIVLSFVASISAQRISGLTIEGLTSLVPFAAFNPTNNSETVPGDGQIIYPDGTDFSNVNVSLNYGTEATLDAPVPWPTNWTNTVTGIKITSTVSPYNWALYGITLKKIKPAALPFEIKTGTGNFDSNSWTTETVGWAGACIDKGQSVIRFGSSKRSFMVAFTGTPDSLIYTIKFLATPWNTANVFDIDGSADGITWTSIMQYNATNPMPLSSPTVITRLKISPQYRYIRWVYTTRSATNVSLENILVTKDASSSVLSPQEQGVRLYATTNQSVRIENSEEVKSLRVYNISGALVLEEMNPSAVVSTNGLVSGVYLGEMILKSGNIVTKKFFK